MDQPKLEVEYPAADEVVSSGHYTFRVAATETLVEAEISIDRGPWQPCRHACGFWWYDWTGYGAGPHQVAARGMTRDGRALNSTFRRFDVSFRK
ncbi:MAG TPA: hypothetical protein VN915_11185 [Elusimicrobiota bacterium]|nr:hypothetical protein [Elusimicrobiota bacterium]